MDFTWTRARNVAGFPDAIVVSLDIFDELTLCISFYLKKYLARLFS